MQIELLRTPSYFVKNSAGQLVKHEVSEHRSPSSSPAERISRVPSDPARFFVKSKTGSLVQCTTADDLCCVNGVPESNLIPMDSNRPSGSSRSPNLGVHDVNAK